MFLLFIFSALSLSAQTPTNDLPTLAPAYGELPPTIWEQHSSSILIMAAVAFIIAALVTVLALRPKRAGVVPPEVEARRELEEFRLRAEDGAVLSRVSQIVRRYFIAKFNLPPGEYTTAEFCRVISADEKLDAELLTHVSEFLRTCDEKKFSADRSSSSPGAVLRAFGLIEMAERRRGNSTQWQSR